MARQQDFLGQFAKLLQQLTQERDQIRSRLAALNEALGEGQPEQQVTSAAPKSVPAAAKAPSPTKNATGLGMREAIQQVTASQPLRVREIVEAMQQLGYRFKSTNPVNSVGAYLYGKEGKKYFRKGAAGFSPIGGRAGARTVGSKPAKRKMSAAGRRAIAEGARKRWAAYKATKKK